MSDASKETEASDSRVGDECIQDNADQKPAVEAMEMQNEEGGDAATEESVTQDPASTAAHTSSVSEQIGSSATADSFVKSTSEGKSESTENVPADAEAASKGMDIGAEGTTSEIEAGLDAEVELICFKVLFNKKKYEVILPIDSQISDLKDYLEAETNVAPAMQKIMIKGPARDTQTLRELKVSSSTKCMMIGSTAEAVKSVASPSKETIRAVRQAAKVKEPLSKQKVHARVIEKHGKPDDVVPGIKGRNDKLPTVPLAGMINKTGGKVRLTFKMELDQLWIGTKDRTNKVPMTSVKQILSEPIQGEEDYHIMGIQLGPTELSCYWIYWVPAQYVNAIKDTILGKWQPF